MAKMNGCNSDMPKGTVGTNETRVNPATAGRNNLSKGGVNKHSGGSDVWGKKAAVKSGGVAQGKNHQMPKGH